MGALLPLSSQLPEETAEVGPHPLLNEPALIVKPEDVHQVPDYPLAVLGANAPTGDCANSRTNLPSIQVWQAM